ncbi:hypothetical protein IAT38_006502 [Cryptococcus sp. DSM 104549]
MARKRSGKSGASSSSKPNAAPGARINKMETYEDTLEPGSVDDFMFKRDQISFNPQNESDDEDVNADQGEEVLSLNRQRRPARAEQVEENEEEEEEAPRKKERKTKAKPDLSGKGRFGKPIVDSDEESESESGSDSESEDENWGRQYYSKPSNRREKEKEGAFEDEEREQEREMEEREVRRLQKKQREVLGGDDFGMVDDDEPSVSEPVRRPDDPTDAAGVPAPPSSATPEDLLRHLQAHEPLKLALTRDFPLIVKRLEKTARGIKRMEEEEGEGQLHKGLGWLHYQTLLTYATTLAFYIHVNALSASSRPDLPILPRLLQLKQGLAMLQDLDFDAASVSEGGVVLNNPLDGLVDDEDDEELMEGKAELIKRMQAVNGMEWEDEADDLWQKEGLEDDELAELLRDAEADDEEEIQHLAKKKKGKKSKSKKAEAEIAFDESDEEEIAAKPKKVKKSKKAASSSSAPAFAPLDEPEFFTSKPSKSRPTSAADELDPLGDPTALTDADFSDKQTRKRSLAFHTSKINATLARRAEGRANRMGGDEDLPYRDKRKARDAALQRNGPRAEGEDLEDVSAGAGVEKKEKKRARDEMEDLDGEGEGGEDDADGYYELVKRRRKEDKAAKDAEHEAYEAEMIAARAGYDEESTDGPRGLTRAIEKNRGLTPRRSKSGRNPRVKKRQAYEKAQKKVGSQRSVYKGGESAYGGEYRGEKTGISKVVKSRKF